MKIRDIPIGKYLKVSGLNDDDNPWSYVRITKDLLMRATVREGAGSRMIGETLGCDLECDAVLIDPVMISMDSICKGIYNRIKGL